MVRSCSPRANTDIRLAFTEVDILFFRAGEPKLYDRSVLSGRGGATHRSPGTSEERIILASAAPLNGECCAVLLADKAPSIARVNGCEWEGLLWLAASEASQVTAVAACRATGYDLWCPYCPFGAS